MGAPIIKERQNLGLIELGAVKDMDGNKKAFTFPGHDKESLYNCFAKYSLGSVMLVNASSSFLLANISSENAVWYPEKIS